MTEQSNIPADNVPGVTVVEPIEGTNILPEQIIGFTVNTGAIPDEMDGHVVRVIARNGTVYTDPAEDFNWSLDADHPNAYDLLYWQLDEPVDYSNDNIVGYEGLALTPNELKDDEPVAIDPVGAAEYAEHMRNVQQMINTGIGSAMVAIRPTELMRDSLRVLIDDSRHSDDVVVRAAADRLLPMLAYFDKDPSITITHASLEEFSLRYDVIVTPLLVGDGYTVAVVERDFSGVADHILA